jgi:type VI secretion system protein ImpF
VTGGRVRTELERTVQPSILDRLTDESPQVPGDPPVTREASVRAFRASVQRDVGWLLNTRRSIVPLPPGCPELVRSVHEFGLPDTTSVPVGSKRGRENMIAMMQDAIERFEPRLASPRVRIIEVAQVHAPQVRFTVEATLRMDPSPEAVTFDAVLEVARGEYDVAPGSAPSGR